jgi:hypothetical protein
MKTRSGFVSNSSSSNYIVDIGGITLDDFYQTLFQEYAWSIFDKAKIKTEIYKYYDEAKSRLTQTKGKAIFEKQPFQSVDEHWFKVAKNYKDRFDALETDAELVEFVLDYHHILTNETEIGVEMLGNTSCHNDFGDMPELMREFTLYFLMDTKHKVKGRRIDTQ